MRRRLAKMDETDEKIESAKIARNVHNFRTKNDE